MSIMGRGTAIRVFGLLSVPLFIYITGGLTVLRATWLEECSVPCFEVMAYGTIRPITESWITVGHYGGIVGQALFAVAILFWVLFFVDPAIRGPI